LQCKFILRRRENVEIEVLQSVYYLSSYSKSKWKKDIIAINGGISLLKDISPFFTMVSTD